MRSKVRAHHLRIKNAVALHLEQRIIAIPLFSYLHQLLDALCVLLCVTQFLQFLQFFCAFTHTKREFSNKML